MPEVYILQVVRLFFQWPILKVQLFLPIFQFLVQFPTDDNLFWGKTTSLWSFIAFLNYNLSKLQKGTRKPWILSIFAQKSQSTNNT